MSDKKPLTTGIRQGDSLSPTLFNIIVDEIITEVEKVERGYQMGDKKIKAICYADDVVLISESEDGLQRLLYKIEQTASTFNMLISTSKTQCLTKAMEPLGYKLAVYGKIIEQVMNFKYLIVTITLKPSLYRAICAI